jgi:zinc/manganese transport system ATP-binding protein
MNVIHTKMMQTKAQSKIVVAKNLAVGYRGKSVWHDANFSVNRGEFVAVIGPNGAGKTTLFRMLLGLQQPISGTIKVFGTQPRRGNQRIGYVPQRHTIDNETNIGCVELVRLAFSGNRLGFGILQREEKKAACDALNAVGAAELADKALGSLSGGELQRVFLAEALVSNPEVLLLDEPLSNLDIRRIKELVELINRIARSRGVTVFLVAHDINPLVQFLDKVVYIANGKVATGAPKDVLTSKRLTELYGTRVEVLRDSNGNIVIVGAENPHEGEKHAIQR